MADEPPKKSWIPWYVKVGYHVIALACIAYTVMSLVDQLKPEQKSFWNPQMSVEFKTGD